MVIIGCDFHPVFQQIAVMDTETGEVTEHKLMHADGEAEQFYRKRSTPDIAGPSRRSMRTAQAMRCVASPSLPCAVLVVSHCMTSPKNAGDLST